MIFTWDKDKAEENIKKHRVSFDEAKTIFYDSATEILLDKEHSSSAEIRYKAVGYSGIHNLTMIFTVLDEDKETIRIISAWKVK